MNKVPNNRAWWLVQGVAVEWSPLYDTIFLQQQHQRQPTVNLYVSKSELAAEAVGADSMSNGLDSLVLVADFTPRPLAMS